QPRTAPCDQAGSAGSCRSPNVVDAGGGSWGRRRPVQSRGAVRGPPGSAGSCRSPGLVDAGGGSRGRRRRIEARSPRQQAGRAGPCRSPDMVRLAPLWGDRDTRRRTGGPPVLPGTVAVRVLLAGIVVLLAVVSYYPFRWDPPRIVRNQVVRT